MCYTLGMSMQPTSQRYGSSGYSARRPRLILIGLIGLCGLFVYAYNGRLAELDAVNAELASGRARADEVKRQHAELIHVHDQVRDDAYVDKVARPWLDYVQPGDIPTTIVKTAPAVNANAVLSAETAAAAPDARRSAPVWQQWVNFFAADTTPRY